MDAYQEVPTADGEFHTETCTTTGRVSKESCLNDLTDKPSIPERYDATKDTINVDTPDACEMFNRACGNSFPVSGVLFECGVFVWLFKGDTYNETFMKQIDGDLLLYKAPGDGIEVQKSLEQTAAWWRAMRSTMTRDDVTFVLKALYKLSSMPYPILRHPGSKARVRATFEEKGKNSPATVHAVVHTLSSAEYDVMAIVHADPQNDGRWPSDDCERMLGIIGTHMIRHCKMQPRFVSIHNNKQQTTGAGKDEQEK